MTDLARETVMTKLNLRTFIAATVTSSVALAVASSAWAHDDRYWGHGRWEHRDHHRYERVEYRRYHEPAPRVVYERPVMVMPAPVYRAPAYSQPVDPNVNLNFTIPLR
jgi:hypothetical protein